MEKMTVAILLVAGIGITALELLRMWIMNRLRKEAMKHLPWDEQK